MTRVSETHRKQEPYTLYAPARVCGGAARGAGSRRGAVHLVFTSMVPPEVARRNVTGEAVAGLPEPVKHSRTDPVQLSTEFQEGWKQRGLGCKSDNCEH